MGELTKKQGDLLNEELIKIAGPMDRLKEMCRKDIILKKKFEVLDNLLLDIFMSAVPEVKRKVDRLNAELRKDKLSISPE